MNYAYNEDLMMEGIRAVRAERKLAAVQKPPVVQKLSVVQEAPVKPLKPAIGTELIIRTAERFGVKPQMITSNMRDAHLVRAREVVILILRQTYGYGIQRIGSILHRHHTTVYHCEVNARHHYETIPTFKDLVDSIAGGSIIIQRDENGLPIESEESRRILLGVSR